jgi:hypothetical protein
MGLPWLSGNSGRIGWQTGPDGGHQGGKPDEKPDGKPDVSGAKKNRASRDGNA